MPKHPLPAGAPPGAEGARAEVEAPSPKAFISPATPLLHKRCPACDAVADLMAGECARCGGRIEQVLPVTGDPNLGREIDSKFTIERELGRGGMGVVYAARHHGLGAPVALKLLPASIAKVDEVRARFRNEARAAGQVRHPHIVRVLDFGETSAGELYLAMELLEGETLGDILAREAPLAPPRVRALALQLLDGLGEAHALGIVHRDLKPDNLLVERRRSGAEHLKILDFGIAREERAGSRLTGVGDLLGTPAYMSPEQVLGEKVDARSDLYAVGILLYEFLTGSVPFADCTSTLEVLRAHVERPVPEFRELAAALGDGVRVVLQRALAKRPEDRFPTAEAFAGALANALAEGPTRAAIELRATPAPQPAPAPSPMEAEAAALASPGPGVNLVLGGEGAGKTTLARRFVELQRARGRTVLATSGQLASLPRPLAVARALTLAALGARDGDWGQRVGAQPEGDRLGLRVLLDDPATAAVPYPTRRREASAAFAALLQRTDADLVIDDAHAIDGPSWSLLEPLLAQPGGRHVLLLSMTVLPPFAASLVLPARDRGDDGGQHDIGGFSAPARALLALVVGSEAPLSRESLVGALPEAQLDALIAELLARGVPLDFKPGLRIASPSERFAWYRHLPPATLRAAQTLLFRVAALRGDAVGAASMALCALDSEAGPAGAPGGLQLDQVAAALITGGDAVRERFDDAGAQRAYRAALDIVRRQVVPAPALKEAGAAAAERLARMARYRGEMLGAEMLAREAMRLSSALPVQVAGRRSLRRVAATWGLGDRAEVEARAAVHLADRLDDTELLAECYAELAETLFEVGAPSAALRELAAALASLQRRPGASPLALSSLVAAQVAAAVRLASHDLARERLAAWQQATAALPCSASLLRQQLALIPLAGRIGALDRGTQLAMLALEAAQRLGDRHAMAAALRALSALHGPRSEAGREAAARAAALEEALAGARWGGARP